MIVDSIGLLIFLIRQGIFEYTSPGDYPDWHLNIAALNDDKWIHYKSLHKIIARSNLKINEPISYHRYIALLEKYESINKDREGVTKSTT